MASDRLQRAQLALPLDQKPAYGREDFLIADCNREALAWIEAWPRWPGPLAVLAGPEGSGKTHLAHIWCSLSGADTIDVESLDLDSIAGAPLAIENIDRATDDVHLLHALNRAAGAGGYVLATARVAPGYWRGRLPDLVSRLRAAPTIEIGRPDDGLITAVLLKLFRDRQIEAPSEAIAYLLRHMERSLEAARQTVDKADRLALAERRPVTIPLLRRVLTG